MGEERVWPKAPRVSRTIPFGYIIDPEDDKVLLPVPLELEALEKARGYLKQFSYRQVSTWLEQVTGRSISHAGLKRRLANDLSRKRRVAAFSSWASRAEKAKQEIRKLQEKGRIGDVNITDHEHSDP